IIAATKIQRRLAGEIGSGISVEHLSVKDGRAGEIRTRDPQHPMLMRYQAALLPAKSMATIVSARPRCNAPPRLSVQSPERREHDDSDEMGIASKYADAGGHFVWRGGARRGRSGRAGHRL